MGAQLGKNTLKKDLTITKRPRSGGTAAIK